MKLGRTRLSALVAVLSLALLPQTRIENEQKLARLQAELPRGAADRVCRSLLMPRVSSTVVHQALEDLGVPVELRQRAVEDLVQVLEPYLQLRPGFNACNVGLDLAGSLARSAEVCFQMLDVDVDVRS